MKILNSLIPVLAYRYSTCDEYAHCKMHKKSMQKAMTRMRSLILALAYRWTAK